MKVRIYALLLAGLLALGLTGCNRRTEPSAPPPPPSMSPSSDVLDVAERTLGFPSDTVLFTVNGADITAEVYLYWLGYTTSYYDSMLQSNGVAIDWTQELDGSTLGEYLKHDAAKTARLYSLIASKASELGCSLNADQLAELVASRQEAVDNLGGEEAYSRQLQRTGVRDETLSQINSTIFLFENIKDKLYGGENTPGSETLAAYADENDLLAAKHILIFTIDMMTYATLSEEELAEATALAEDLLAQLQASDALDTDFDTLMYTYSEDTGLASNPDGYVFTSGEFVDEFEEATRALGYGEMSGLVESSYGYHIILRLPPDSELMRQEYASTQIDLQMDGWMQAAEVEYLPAYEEIDTQHFYENLMAFHAELDAEDELGNE